MHKFATYFAMLELPITCVARPVVGKSFNKLAEKIIHCLRHSASEHLHQRYIVRISVFAVILLDF